MMEVRRRQIAMRGESLRSSTILLNTALARKEVVKIEENKTCKVSDVATRPECTRFIW